MEHIQESGAQTIRGIFCHPSYHYQVTMHAYIVATRGGMAYPAALTHDRTVMHVLLSEVTVIVCFNLYH